MPSFSLDSPSAPDPTPDGVRPKIGGLWEARMLGALFAFAAMGLPQAAAAEPNNAAITVPKTRPASAFEQMVSKSAMELTRGAPQADTAVAASWVSNLTLVSPFVTRLGLVRHADPAQAWGVGANADAELVLEDKDGVSRTLISFRQVSTGAPGGWASWVTLGGVADLANRFGPDRTGGSDFTLDVPSRSILGVGPQPKNPDRPIGIVDQSLPFLTYKGFERSSAPLGYFTALGLVDPSRILFVRKHLQPLSLVADVWCGANEMLGDQADGAPGPRPARAWNTASPAPGNGKETIGGFLFKHHIGPTGACRSSYAFEKRPSQAQDADLPLSLSESLSYRDTVYAGDHQDGRRFVVASLQVPTLPVWVLFCQYDDETYPRMAIFVHDLVGLTRDGKHVSWIRVPQIQVIDRGSDGRINPSVQTAPPTIGFLNAMARGRIEWTQKVVLDTQLDVTNTQIDGIHNGSEGVVREIFWLRSAINGVRLD